MGVLRLSGSLDGGPASSTTESFPASSFSAPLRFRENTKGFSVATGVLTRKLNSVGAFVPLQGVGATDTVTKGTFLYLKSDAAIEVRLTTDDGSGGSVLAVLPPSGFVMIELDPVKFLKLLEAKGLGSLEYFVCGNE